MDVELQGRIDDTLIKMKAEKARLLDERMAKRLHDEEVEKAASKEKQENDDLEKSKGLQQQYDDKQENIDWNAIIEQIQENHLDNIRKYQSLKRKPVSIAQARKNMIVYLKNMVGYKMEHFRGMTYDKVRPIFEREYNKVQTLFKPDKDVKEPKKKRVAEETLLQESFKKLKAVEVSVAEFKVKALQVRLIKEKFSSSVPDVDKEKALWVELKRLFEPDTKDVIWKLQRLINQRAEVWIHPPSDQDDNLKKLNGLLGKDDYAAEGLKKLL
nr:hypothetical protein [Tanacetum cinerariifolium]